MERRKLIKGIAALAIAERLGMLRSAWAAGARLPGQGIYRISGTVQLNGRPAREGMPVGPGDTITTGPDGEVIYIVGKDAFLQRDRSVVSITGDAVKSGLRVLTGKLLSVFGKGDKRIVTPTATIGIRGTGCYIEASPERVYFCLCYGTAEIGLPDDPVPVETITTRYHDHPLYLHADRRKMMVPASVINHTDAELMLLEQVVGRTPPFYDAEGKFTGKY